ncbi:MAG: ElyC/SanA/YdcF family protein [Bacteroidota bacterium]|nr:ElyC/SanA/YdcF family protein [Bacteroidota bacterium]
MKRLLNILVFLAIGVIVFAIGLQFHIKRLAQPITHTSVLEAPHAYTGIVLGASVKANGNLSAILQDRVDAALMAYQEKKIERFLLSGDHAQKGYDEVNAMKKYLNKKGVPDSVIFLDHAGLDTYDSMFRAKNIFQVDTALVFTQEFHLPRALYIGKNMGLNINGVIADARIYEGNSHFKRREWAANIKAWMEINIENPPKIDGSAIPITGKSQLSHDK